jgi:hypothetical protein
MWQISGLPAVLPSKLQRLQPVEDKNISLITQILALI